MQSTIWEIDHQAELDQQREIAIRTEKLSAIGGLLAGIAHELNNPLSIVIGYAMMMQNSVDDPALKKQVDNIAQAAERCSRIVKTFLTMARQHPMEVTQCSINEAILAALDIAGQRLRSAEVDVEIDLDVDLPDVEADEDQIIQAFTNLIVNSEHALAQQPQPRRLILESIFEQQEERAIISIEDNGPGIPAAAQSRIFEPFFTTKEVGEGSGIGLAFSHRVAMSHGGELTVHSTPGHGAKFQFVLPCLARVKTKASNTIKKNKLCLGRVLIIDDEIAIADVLGDILTNAGYDVEKRYDPRQALALLRSEQFDAILSDVRMPGLDGPALFTELKKLNPALAKKMAFITGDTLSKNVVEFLSASSQPYLEKPATSKEILNLLSDLISDEN